MRSRQSVGTLSKADAIHHVVYRSAGERHLFPIAVLYDTCRRYANNALAAKRGALLTYLFLPQEAHFIVRLSAEDAVAQFAQRFAQVYARARNRATRDRGHVFGGHYKSIPLTSPVALAEDVWLLFWRPVALKLVATPRRYPHSSLRALLNIVPPRRLQLAAVRHAFGAQHHTAIGALRAAMRRRPGEKELQKWEQVIGVVSYRIATAADVDPDVALSAIESWSAWQSSLGSLAALRHGRSAAAARARALVACVATASGLCTASALARHYGYARSTLSEHMTACRADHDNQRLLATPVAQILAAAAAAAAARDSGRAVRDESRDEYSDSAA